MPNNAAPSTAHRNGIPVPRDQPQTRQGAGANRRPSIRDTAQAPWRSSLDLVWSYSRSQAFYGDNISTSPSFVDRHWAGPSHLAGYPGRRGSSSGTAYHRHNHGAGGGGGDDYSYYDDDYDRTTEEDGESDERGDTGGSTETDNDAATTATADEASVITNSTDEGGAAGGPGTGGGGGGGGRGGGGYYYPYSHHHHDMDWVSAEEQLPSNATAQARRRSSFASAAAAAGGRGASRSGGFAASARGGGGVAGRRAGFGVGGGADRSAGGVGGSRGATTGAGAAAAAAVGLTRNRRLSRLANEDDSDEERSRSRSRSPKRIGMSAGGGDAGAGAGASASGVLADVDSRVVTPSTRASSALRNAWRVQQDGGGGVGGGGGGGGRAAAAADEAARRVGYGSVPRAARVGGAVGGGGGGGRGEVALRDGKPASESTPLLADEAIDTRTKAAGKRTAFGTGGGNGGGGGSGSGSSYARFASQGFGTSTFWQSWFNTVNALVGVGILTLPLALSYAGWILGVALFVLCGAVTNYTGKLLADVMAREPKLRTYADVGSYAFGKRARLWVGLLFCLELWAVGTALIILFGDSMYAMVQGVNLSAHLEAAGVDAAAAAAAAQPLVHVLLRPVAGALQHWPPAAFKALGLVVVLPTVFLPLRLLSPVSVVGILSITTLFGVVVADGCLKPDSPGSLLRPAPTALSPDWSKLPLSFGLILSGFSSHPVIPSLFKDMRDPRQFGRMLDLAYLAATAIYLGMGVVGYLMFGAKVTDEISRDLARTPGYPEALNRIAIWLIIINPLSKFALAVRPINTTLELLAGVDRFQTAPSLDPSHPSTPTTGAPRRVSGAAAPAGDLATGLGEAERGGKTYDDDDDDDDGREGGRGRARTSGGVGRRDEVDVERAAAKLAKVAAMTTGGSGRHAGAVVGADDGYDGAMVEPDGSTTPVGAPGLPTGSAGHSALANLSAYRDGAHRGAPWQHHPAGGRRRDARAPRRRHHADEMRSAENPVADSRLSRLAAQTTSAWSPRTKLAVRLALRTAVTLLVGATAVALPGFETVMALLGALLAFTTCILGPVLANLTLFHRDLSRARIVADVVLLSVSLVLAALGTVWAFKSAMHHHND